MDVDKEGTSPDALEVRRIVGHALLSLGVGVTFMLLNRPEVLVITRLGVIVWYPGTGFIIAFMLGMTPWYGLISVVGVALSGILIYSQPVLTWGGTVGAVAFGGCFAAAANILRGSLKIDPGFQRRQDVIRYLSVTTIASLGSTAVGTACLVADHTIIWSNYGSTATKWFLGDEIGLLGVTPFLMIYVLPWVRGKFLASQTANQQRGSREKTKAGGRPLDLLEIAEAVGEALSILVVIYLTFAPILGSLHASFLCFIPVVWMAMRQGIRGVVGGLLALNFGIVFALHFVSPSPEMHMDVCLLMLVVSAIGLLVGSTVSERQRITQELAERTLQVSAANRELGREVVERKRSEQVTLALLEREQVSAQNAREQRALSEAVIQGLPALVCLVDTEGRLLRWNKMLETTLGYAPEELSRLRLMDAIAEEDRALAQGKIEQVFAEGAGEVEASLLAKSGSKISCYLSGVRILNDNRPCLLGVCVDITTRKQVEADLRSQTAFLQAQTNSSIDGILVVDNDGKVLLNNRRFADLFRVPPALLAGEDRPLLEYVLTLIKDPASFLAKVQYLYSHPQDTSYDEIEFQDGTILDRYSAPVIDKEGKYYGRIWNFRDVTERRRNEETLRQLSVAVEQSPISVVITDAKGDITYVNHKFAECTGYRVEEVLGRNARILKSGYVSDEVYRKLWGTIRKGAEWRGELCNKKKNGDLYWESATISPVTNAKGEISHFLALKEDITERRLIESLLRQAQKLEAIGQLAAGIAHEINTPTQFVTDNLTFLRDASKALHGLLEQYRDVLQGLPQSALPESVRDTLRQAERDADLSFIADETPRAIEQALEGARRVASIVRAMKEFSHPDSNEETAADLNKAIETTALVARNEWKYVADLETHLDQSLPPVTCHIGEMNQVVLNLIVNAAHAIKDKIKEGEKGRIEVSTRRRGEFAEITVSDTGMGIPESIQSRIFDPFFTTKEVGKGTGQGLTLAHNIIVKKHGGRIWFETRPGEGTTFFLQIPIQAHVASA